MFVKELSTWVDLQRNVVSTNKLTVGHNYLLFDKDLDGGAIVAQKVMLKSINKIPLHHHQSNTLNFNFENLEEFPIPLPHCLEIQYKQTWSCMRMI